MKRIKLVVLSVICLCLGLPAQQDYFCDDMTMSGSMTFNEDWPECLMDDSADTPENNEQEKCLTAWVISRCTEAMGGGVKINEIRSLKIDEIYPDHGEEPMTFEMKRPNLFRNPRANLVFDGKRACWLNGRDNKSRPEMVPAEEWKDFEVDIAFHFPAFFDYPAVYSGSEVIEGMEVVKLKVYLPLGAVMTYFIDCNTWLVTRTEAKFILDGKEYAPYRVYSDYRPVDGVVLPHGFTYGSRKGQMNGWVSSFHVNFPFHEEYVEIPKNLE